MTTGQHAASAMVGGDAHRRQLEAITQNATLALFIMDEHQRCTYMNPAAERLTGFTLAELQGKALHYYVHHTRPDGTPYPLEECPIDQAFPQNMRERGEETFVHKDGHFYSVAFTASPIREGEGDSARTVGTVIEVRDIGEETTRARERDRLVADLQVANDELRHLHYEAQRAERQARFLADLGQALQPLVDPDEVMITVARMLGEHLEVDRCAYAEVEPDEDHFTITGNYTRGDTIGILGRFAMSAFGAEALRLSRQDRPYVVDDVEADPRVTAADRAAYAGTQIRAVISVPLHKAGRFAAGMAVHQRTPRRWTPDEVALVTTVVHRCWESIERARAIRSLGEREAALRATTVELAERTAAAEAAQRDAAQANLAKSDFLATMSHELRTPINAMLGYTQLLELGLAGPLTEQQRSYLERLTTSSRHLLALVNDVLDLSKMEAGEMRVARYDARTGPAVRTALDIVAPEAAARGVRLVDARSSGEGVPFAGDEDRVRQIVLNLLGNAVKFTPSGGTVTVSSESVDEAPPDAAHLHGAGPWAYVRVEDTGVGIPPEEQGRIFEPFHQVPGGTRPYTRQQGGSGLGLTISRRLSRLMGGDLTVASTPGVGSTFTLWLPAVGQLAGAPVETAGERGARATHDAVGLETPGLAVVGELLRESVDDVLAAYADRLRADPAIPGGRELRRTQLEDHGVSFLADLAQSLVIIGDAGPEAADLLRDGSAIQRTIAEHHGARRFAQGWDEAAVRRDHRIFREEVERALRGRLRPESGDARDLAVDEAVRVVVGIVDRAEAISVRGWRVAAADPDRGGRLST